MILGVAAVLVYSCFYAYRAGLNIGLALCIFTASALVFIILLYWIVYSQTISAFDAIGIVIIFAGVFLIALGGQQHDQENQENDNVKDQPSDEEIKQNLNISIVLAVLAAIILAFGGLQITFVSKNYPKISQFQLTFDAQLIFVVVLTPLFIYELL